MKLKALINLGAFFHFDKFKKSFFVKASYSKSMILFNHFVITLSQLAHCALLPNVQ